MKQGTRTFHYGDGGKLSTGGDPAWSVEAADQEARRLHRHAERASGKLLALLRRFHEHGQGELALAPVRRLRQVQR